MKLPKRTTVYHGGKRYREEAPSAVLPKKLKTKLESAVQAEETVKPKSKKKK